MATEDQWSHQQNETSEQQRVAGSHWGADPDQGHSTAIGAAAATIGDKFSRGGDPNFSGHHTVHPQATEGTIPYGTQDGTYGVGQGPQISSTSTRRDVLCGPLLNYKRMSNAGSENPIWHGTVLIVTTPGQSHPELQLRCVGRVGTGADNTSLAVNGGSSLPTGLHTSDNQSRTFRAVKLYEDPRKAFWRFEIDLPFQSFEAKWKYYIPGLHAESRGDGSQDSSRIFTVPSTAQSMRILFHSCNGFSVGTDVDAWSGPALWNDVLRMHNQQPFHVMIGGGDQIYNDGVRVNGPLRQWTDIGNPKKRRDFPFNEELRAKCDEYYFNNYIRWYSSEPFKTANGQIPQLNIWDDHDIIDGFGSYTDHFMRCAVFRGIGGVAHKYYMLFQHHLAPPKSTFTTDAPRTMHSDGLNGTPADPVQLKDTFVMTESREDESYIIGPRPGPYVEERSRSMYCQLGARIAFAGIDARTERTRHRINYPETYDLIFNRLSKEFSANKNIKHLILLLGVPIAYPRLQWLENIFASPILGPIRFLNKRFGLGGSFFNNFDGNVDLLDDLDDHYTAHQHKAERRELVFRLQELAKRHSVRITILGGDVHLAAIGRFYSNPKLGIPAERDWRYASNIISSAITNKPPPAAVANLLARRNKIHHLDHDTDETLLEFFDHDPGIPKDMPNGDAKKENGGPGKKTADWNHATMPSRNYAIISESHDFSSGSLTTNGYTNGTHGHGIDGAAPTAALNGTADTDLVDRKGNPRHPIHTGEMHAGTMHPAASGLQRTGLCGPYGLDVTLRVEISPSDREGHTQGYGLSIPSLDSRAYSNYGEKW